MSKTTIYKRLKVATVAIVLLPCTLVLVWFFILPLIDHAHCIPKVADKLGVNPSIYDIKDYITVLLEPGMTREEVNNGLGNIAPISITEGNLFLGNQVTEQIYLKICRHPYNNIVIYARYDLRGKLKNIFIESNDG
ncbi:MAG: hypothetical protein Fur0022_09150 [Anaerolineales bacterium]